MMIIDTLVIDIINFIKRKKIESDILDSVNHRNVCNCERSSIQKISVEYW